MKRIFFALTVVCASFGTTMAQDNGADAPSGADTVKLPYKHKVKYAEKHLEAGNYYDAQGLYQGLNAKKPEDLKVLYKLAESYRLARDYKAAEAGYKVVLDNDAAKYPEARYYYALMLQMNGKYAEAKTAFDAFVGEKSGTGDKAMLKFAQLQSEACAWALGAQPVTYKVQHLTAPINRNKTEYAPRVVGTTLYFSSLNNDTVLNTGLNVPGKMFSHAYTATLTGNSWGNVQPLQQPLNVAGKHSGNASVTEDGKRVYLTICDAVAENQVTCKIYVSTKDDKGVWSKPKALGTSVNAEGSDNTHPSVAKTENNADVLYFSSNRGGGKGGYDIYKVEVKHTGTAGTASNLESINTEWDEITPNFNPRKNQLYFSSNGRIGFGGFDNYSADLGTDNKFAEPVNLGSPLNSPADDMGYTVGEDKKLFYFVSNRVGIIGDKSETCCDDIFKAENTFKPTLALSGEIIQRIDSTEQHPLEGVRVEVYDITDGIPKLVYADSLGGKTGYLVPLEADKNYSFKFSKKEHFTAHHTVSTMDLEKNDTLKYTATLDKIIVNKSYRLSKIFYEYKSAKLTKESEATLDTLYTLLTENPEIVIELSSHTDSIGSDSYNLDLSDARAKSCAEYLVAKGLDPARIIPKGYGRNTPVAPNTIAGKDNPDGRAQNRRTEFKVLAGKLVQKGDKIVFE